MKLRDYQDKAIRDCLDKLKRLKVCYLAGEVRTGKTLVALSVADLHGLGRHRILFITKLKAISSIHSDIEKLNMQSEIEVVNYESLHKVNWKPSFIIYDEAHCLGAFPKPSKRTAEAHKRFAGLPTILMSGTPSPESYSQLFHQFWITGSGPWLHYKNFYKWANDFVIVKKIFVGLGRQINDYKQTKDSVVKMFHPYMVTMTQEEAGFTGTVVEKVHNIPIPFELKELLRTLKKDKLDAPRNLIGDTGAKLMSMYHQISSGTVIDADQNYKILDTFKVDYIKKNFNKTKLVIFYVYKSEGEMLKKAFYNWTDDPDEFNRSMGKPFICQVVSGREGINLSTADDIVFLNISFSAVTYWQARARSQSLEGGDSRVHWLFSDGGIESKIYQVVQVKTSFTKKHFDGFIRSRHSEEDNQTAKVKRLGRSTITRHD